MEGANAADNHPGQDHHNDVSVDMILLRCRLLSDLLLNYSLENLSEIPLFAEDTISLMYNIANQVEASRKRKNFGVIGGSAAGIVGGVLSITGAVLIPFTFGISIGLIAAGVGVGLAGSGVSLGFSIDKMVGDKKRKSIVTKSLEEFVEFQMDFLTSLVNIFYVRLSVEEREAALDPGQMEGILINCDYCAKVENLITQHEARNVPLNAENMIQALKQIRSESEVLKKAMISVEAAVNLGNPLMEANPLDAIVHFLPAIKAYQIKREDTKTFIGYARKYMGIDFDRIPTRDVILASSIGVGASSSAVIRAGSISSRVAVRALDISDNLAQVGGNALKIAKGFSAAGIVLGALGVVVDIGFLGHAVYDLVKNEKEEFSKGLIAVGDMMKQANISQIF